MINQCRSGTAALLWVLLSSAGPALAQGAVSAASRERALDLFDESEAAYRQGEFERAVRLLEESYAIVPAPAILYNMARSLEGLGRPGPAADAYARYLREAGDVEDRGAIERRVEALRAYERRLQQGGNETQEQDLESDTLALEWDYDRAQQSASRPRLTAPVLTIVGGGLVIGGGVVAGIFSRSLHDDAVAENEHREAVSLQDRAIRLSRTANTLFIVGGVAALVGLIWLIVRLRRAPETPSALLPLGTYF